IPDIKSWDQLLPGGVNPPVMGWDELLPKQKAPGESSIRTPGQKVAQMAEEAGVKPDESKGQSSSDEGFWPLVGRSFMQSAVTAGQEVGAGAAAAVPSAIGGSTVAQQAATLPEPDAQDEVTKLSQKPITSDWTNSRMWGVKIGGWLGSTAPTAALGGAGAVAGGMAGGAAGAVFRCGVCGGPVSAP